LYLYTNTILNYPHKWIVSSSNKYLYSNNLVEIKEYDLKNME